MPADSPILSSDASAAPATHVALPAAPSQDPAVSKKTKKDSSSSTATATAAAPVPTTPSVFVAAPYRALTGDLGTLVAGANATGEPVKKVTVSIVGMPDSGRSMLANAWQSAARKHPCRPLAVGGGTGDEKRRTLTAHTVPIVKGRLDVRVIPGFRRKEDADETLRAMMGCDADGSIIATAVNSEQHGTLLQQRAAAASDVIVVAIPMGRLMSSDPEDRVDVEDFIVSVTSLSQQYSPDQDRPEVTNAPQLLFVITKVDEVVEPGTGPECLLGKEKSSSASLQLAFTHLKEHGGAPVHTVAMGFLDDDDVAWNNAADPRVVVLKHLSKLCTKWGDRHDEQEDTLRRAV